MKLNLPIELNPACNNVLIAGAGGGFDVFAGLPIAYELQEQGKNVVLANMNIDKRGFDCRESIPEDYPEHNLKSIAGFPIYTLPKEGIQTVAAGYKKIVEKHKVDAIILCDAGVDSLMTGVEEGAGTILEDFISLSAVNQTAVKQRILTCIGFGTETEEEVCHYHALSNMATLIKDGAFLGSCALTKDMKCFQLYSANCMMIWEQNRKSHIHTKIIPAVWGEFGNFPMYQNIDAKVLGAKKAAPFITPFMSLYWFFDLDKVVARNSMINQLKNTKTFTDVMMLFRQIINTKPLTKHRRPLSL
jgi:hypothetical protein